MKGFGTSPKPTKSFKSSSSGNIMPPRPSGNQLDQKLPIEQLNTTLSSISIESSMSNHFPSFDLTFPDLRVLHIDPPVVEIPHFMSDAVCEEFISIADNQGYRIPSQTFGGSNMNAGSIRTSTTWYMNYSAVDIFVKKVEKLLNWPSNRFEEPQIVRYEFGQQVTQLNLYVASPRIEVNRYNAYM
jgi:hypothetical protein